MRWALLVDIAPCFGGVAGSWLVAGAGTFTPPGAFLDVAGSPFDRRFVDRVRDVTGVDIRGVGDDMPALLGEWRP